MRCISYHSGWFDTMDKAEAWVQKQERRSDFCVVNSGSCFYINKKFRSYVSGYKTDLASRLARTFGSLKRGMV